MLGVNATETPTDCIFCKDGLVSTMLRQHLLRQQQLKNYQQEVELFEERWRKSVSKVAKSLERYRKNKTNNISDLDVGNVIGDFTNQQKTVPGHKEKSDETITPETTINMEGMNFHIMENYLKCTSPLPPIVLKKSLSDKVTSQMAKINELKTIRLENKKKRDLKEKEDLNTIIEIKESIIGHYKDKYSKLVKFTETSKAFLLDQTVLEQERAVNNNVETEGVDVLLSDKRTLKDDHIKNAPCTSSASCGETSDSKERSKFISKSTEPAKSDLTTTPGYRSDLKGQQMQSSMNKPFEKMKKNDFSDNREMTQAKIIEMKRNRKTQLQNIYQPKQQPKRNVFDKHFPERPSNKRVQSEHKMDGLNSLTNNKVHCQTLNRTNHNSPYKTKKPESTDFKVSYRSKSKNDDKTKAADKYADRHDRRKLSINSEPIGENKKRLNVEERKGKIKESEKMRPSPYMKQKALSDTKINKPVKNKDSRMNNKSYNQYNYTKKITLQQDKFSKDGNEMDDSESLHFVELRNYEKELHAHRKTKPTAEMKEKAKKLGGLYYVVYSLIFGHKNISNFDLDSEKNTFGKPVRLSPDPRPSGVGLLKPRMTLPDYYLFLGDPKATLYAKGPL